MKIYDRNSSMKYEGSSNEARRLQYERKLQEEDRLADEALLEDMSDMSDVGEWADWVVLDDYDMPDRQHTRVQDNLDEQEDLGAAKACLAMLAVWLVAVIGWLLW